MTEDTAKVATLDTLRIDTLETYANDTNSTAQVYAQNMLTYIEGDQWSLELRLPADTSSKKGPGRSLRNDVKIYPNPVSKNLRLDVSNYDEPFVAVVYSIQGRVVKRVEFGEQKDLATLTVNQLSQGVFLLQLRNKKSGELLESLKFVKQ